MKIVKLLEKLGINGDFNNVVNVSMNFLEYKLDICSEKRAFRGT